MAEIRDHAARRPIGNHHQVGRLDVTVHGAERVQVGNALENLLEKQCAIAPVHPGRNQMVKGIGGQRCVYQIDLVDTTVYRTLAVVSRQDVIDKATNVGLEPRLA